MTRKEALGSLLAKTEAGEGFSWAEADVFDNPNLPLHVQNAFYSGSIDAAKALHETVLPGWIVSKFKQTEGKPDHWVVTLSTYDSKRRYAVAESNTPARAWLMAILKALIAQEAE